MKRTISLLLTIVLLLTLFPMSVFADASKLSASEDIKLYVKSCEGIRLKAYHATAREAELGLWTIGYGHLLGTGDYENFEIEEADADAYFEEDIKRFENSVNRFADKYGYKLTQTQFDALFSLAYNFGESWIEYYSWTACTMLKNGYQKYDPLDFANALSSLCHSGGQILTGLLEKRRMKEVNMLLYGDSCFDPYDTHFVYATLNANGGVLPTADVAVFYKNLPYAKLPEPTKTGYYFAGWTTANGTLIENSTIASQSLNLYASWTTTPTKEYHKLTVVGGSGSGYYRAGEMVPVSPEYKAPLVFSCWNDPLGCTTYNNGSYYVKMPDQDVTITSILDCVLGDECPSKNFSDVSLTFWAHNAIDYVTSLGLFFGTSSTTFSPNIPMTRGMLLTVLYRLSGSPDVSDVECPFTDIGDNYYTEAISWGYSNEIAFGYGDTFRPNQPVTREQLAAFLMRYACKIYEFEVNDSSDGLASLFSDAGKISSYSRTAMGWAVSEGIISGYGDRTVRPLNNATRAEVASMLMRFTNGIIF